MKRPLAIAVILAGIILPQQLPAQFRYGSRSFASRPTEMAPSRISAVRMEPLRPAPVRIPVGVSPVRPSPSKPRRSAPARVGIDFSSGQSTPFGNAPNLPAGYFAGTPCLTNPSYAGSFYCSQFLPRHRGTFGAAAFAGYYWYPMTSYSSVDESSTPAQAVEEDTSLANKVDALREQVELLRDEQIERELAQTPSATTQPSQPAVQEKTISTILVYRDGRQSEVQNYAILGKTLWVFAGQTTRKVPLSELDLDVTRKLNEDRGVEFVSEGTL